MLFGVFCGCKGFCHRTESDLFLFLLISSKSRVKILEILMDFRGENVGNIEQVHTLINELNLDKLFLGAFTCTLFYSMQNVGMYLLLVETIYCNTRRTR